MNEQIKWQEEEDVFQPSLPDAKHVPERRSPWGWLVPGCAYVMLSMLLYISWFRPHFSEDFVSTLLLSFLLGFSHVLHGMVQLEYEHSHPEDGHVLAAFTRSVFFVAVAGLVVWSTGLVELRLPAVAALCIGSLVGAVLFAMLADCSVGLRFFVAALAGAWVHQGVYALIHSLAAMQPAATQSVLSGVLAWVFHALVSALPALMVLLACIIAKQWGESFLATVLARDPGQVQYERWRAKFGEQGGESEI